MADDAERPGIESRLVVEYGIELDGIWFPLAMLRRLDQHGPWSTPFTEASSEQANVLVAHGLAEPHNTGLRRGNGLRNFVDASPFEPTTPFRKIREPDKDADGGHGGIGQESRSSGRG